MIYGKYRGIRNASWNVLIDYEINRLPVKVTAITKRAGIKVISNSKVDLLTDSQLAVSILKEDQWYIIYDETMSEQRIRFSLAHELGHIFLGHAMKAGYHAREIAINQPAEEKEADMFAARLLAPACVLWGLKLQTAEDIASVCNISLQAAKHRAQRMKVLYARNKFLISKLEKQVYEQFLGFIQEHSCERG